MTGDTPAQVRPATEREVRAAVAACDTWPVDLAPDNRYVLPHLLEGVEDRICARLGGAPRRVGESTYVLGLAARLWALTLGCVVRNGVLPDPARLGVRDERGAVQLALMEATGWLDVNAEFVHGRVTATLSPVVERSRLAPRLMWGNVASALHATPGVLELTAARPWAAAMLELPPLAGEMRAARRATCCLFYEAGGGLCGDCALERVPVRRAPAGAAGSARGAS